AAAVAARRVRHRLRLNPQDRENVLRSYGGFRTYHVMAQFVLYVLALYLLGWGWVVQTTCVIPVAGEPPTLLLPGPELVLLPPLMAGLVLSWMCYYNAERALYETAHPLVLTRPFWSRSAYVGFHIRQNLAMVLVPVVMLVLLQGLSRLAPQIFEYAWFQALAVLLLVLLIAGLPWVLRL